MLTYGHNVTISMMPYVVGIPILGISGLSLGSLETKWHLGVGPIARHIVYY
jgi:hypothetical protein